MRIKDLEDKKGLLFKYAQDLKENYKFDLFQFIKNNGMNKSFYMAENELKTLRENANFGKDYCRNLLVLSALVKYKEVMEK